MEPLIIIISLTTAATICFLVTQRKVIEYVSGIASCIALGATLSMAFKVAESRIYTPSTLFLIDSLSAIIALLVSLLGFLASLYSIAYLREETKKEILGFRRVKQYFVLLNLFLLAMLTATMSVNPVITWIFIEATTLSTAFLISFYNKPSSMEAAWKYLIINSVGLLMAFMGTLLFSSAIPLNGSEYALTWNTLQEHAKSLDPTIAKLAFAFVLIGYGTKMGLTPMHTWLPDAHGKAPSPISALLSGVLLNVALLTILRFKNIVDIAAGRDYAQHLLIFFGILSVAIASFIIVSQKNYKRLLAYSSIENMGVTALGFGFGGIGATAAILHMIYHSLIKSSLFFTAGNIFLRYSSTKIAEVEGLLSAIPATGILFCTGFLALTGLPPFGLFFTKLSILSAGMEEHLILSVLLILLLTVLFIGFLNHAASMVSGKPPATISIKKESPWLILPPAILLAIALSLSLHIPSFLHSLIQSVATYYSL